MNSETICQSQPPAHFQEYFPSVSVYPCPGRRFAVNIPQTSAIPAAKNGIQSRSRAAGPAIFSSPHQPQFLIPQMELRKQRRIFHRRIGHALGSPPSSRPPLDPPFILCERKTAVKKGSARDCNVSFAACNCA